MPFASALHYILPPFPLLLHPTPLTLPPLYLSHYHAIVCTRLFIPFGTYIRCYSVYTTTYVYTSGTHATVHPIYSFSLLSLAPMMQQSMHLSCAGSGATVVLEHALSPTCCRQSYDMNLQLTNTQTSQTLANVINLRSVCKRCMAAPPTSAAGSSMDEYVEAGGISF